MRGRLRYRPGQRFVINPGSPQAAGLVAWWVGASAGLAPLQERMRGINGAWNAAPTPLLDEQLGEANALNGSTTYATAGVVSNFSFIQNTGIFSILVRARFSDHTADALQTLAGNTGWSSSQKGWCVGYDNRSGYGTKQLRLWVVKGSTGNYVINMFSDTNAITDNLPHLLAFVGNGSYGYIYVDGALVGSAAQSTKSSGDSTYIAALGAGYGGAYPFTGDLGEVRIYDRALSADEIQHWSNPATTWDLYRPSGPLPASRVYDAGLVVEIEDARLNLAAYYQSLDDFGALLRAHDGLEFTDLMARLEASSYDLTDLQAALAAYYQDLEDAPLSLHTLARIFDDLGVNLATYGQAFDDLSAPMALRGWTHEDLVLLLAVASGYDLSDLACALEAIDGTVLSDLGCRLCAIRSIPSFSAIVAQRLSSVMQEV